MKSKTLTARVNDQVMQELTYLQRKLGINSVTEVLTEAVHNYYKSVKQAEPQKSSAEIFKEMGLIGCCKGEPVPSTNYKDVLTDYLEKKHRPILKKRKKQTRHAKQ